MKRNCRRFWHFKLGQEWIHVPRQRENIFFLSVTKKKYAQVAEMRGDIEELERRRTAEHREVAHDAFDDTSEMKL